MALTEKKITITVVNAQGESVTTDNFNPITGLMPLLAMIPQTSTNVVEGKLIESSQSVRLVFTERAE